MKTLLLVRHAKTAAARADQTDHSRALEERGVTDARNLANYLHQNSIVPDEMLVSSAKRTQSTAQILTAGFGDADLDVKISDELYLANVSFLEDVVQNISDDIDTIMIVGHNPGLSELASLYEPDVHGLRPAQMLLVQFNIQRWADAKASKVLAAKLV